MFYLFVILGVVSAMLAVAIGQWRASGIQTVVVRLIGSGFVSLSNKNQVVTDALPELQRAAVNLKSHGFRTRLLIECYTDVSDSERNHMVQIGRSAGFDIVEARALTSPSLMDGEQKRRGHHTFVRHVDCSTGER